MPLKNLRGFPDRMDEEIEKFDSLISLTTRIFKLFDFHRVDTPVLEYSDLFSRTLGKDSDIVNKEMYSFSMGKDSLTLRPEGTAPIARLVVTGKMYKKLPLRLYYHGPMFRHERPQKGRFRQFHHIGVEWIGDSNLDTDVELLSMAWILIQKLSLENKVNLEINTLGSREERKVYKEKLKSYLEPLKNKLSTESQIRLVKNLLRIWDSKSWQDQEIMKKAPVLKDSLTQSALGHYNKIKEKLDFLKIPFTENTKLVRGLDYYNDLVFEFKSSELGSQSSFLAGGRYDTLIENLGGLPTPAVGWAIGLERLSLLCRPFQKEQVDFGLVSVGSKAQHKACLMAYSLRSQGFSVYCRFSGNFSKQMKRVGQRCRFALIYGDKEESREEIILKDLERGEQKAFSVNSLNEEIRKRGRSIFDLS